MSPQRPGQKGDKGKDYRQIAILTAVPAILIAAPLAGFFLGRWADSKVGIEPALTIAGLILGFAAAAREIHGLIKKASDSEKNNEKKL